MTFSETKRLVENENAAFVYAIMTTKTSWGAAMDRLVPKHLQRDILAYVILGKQPSGFREAVLRNNLMDAVDRANEEEMAALKSVAEFIFNYVPSGCWGSKKKIDSWFGVAPDVD